ncbi:MAG: oligopeptidase A, partial [Cellvibrionaceae bacterium]
MITSSSNPLLNWSERPPFDKIEIEQIVPGIDTLLAESETALQQLEASNPSSWDELAHPIEEIEDQLGRVWGIVAHLNAVKNSPELRKVYETAQPKIVVFSNRMNQSRPIYDAFCRLGDSDAWDTFDSAQKRIIEKTIQSATLAGVGLDGAKKERFNEISERMAKITTAFSNNVLDATKAFVMLLTDKEEMAGLSANYLEMTAQSAVRHGHEEATAENGPWAITLDGPVYVPFIKNSPKRALRQKLHTAYVTRGTQGDYRNQEIAEEILALRQEKAELLGFKNHAALSLGQKMAGSAENVDKLLSDLKEAATPAGERDLQDLIDLAKVHQAPEADDIQQWDVTYWAERLRESKFDINEESLRAYFPFKKVMDGMFNLVERIFDIHVVAADGEVAVWHKDVQYFRVQDSAGNDIAAFYFDPYARPEEKRGGAWANPAVQRSSHLTSA